MGFQRIRRHHEVLQSTTKDGGGWGGTSRHRLFKFEFSAHQLNSDRAVRGDMPGVTVQETKARGDHITTGPRLILNESRVLVRLASPPLSLHCGVISAARQFLSPIRQYGRVISKQAYPATPLCTEANGTYDIDQD